MLGFRQVLSFSSAEMEGFCPSPFPERVRVVDDRTRRVPLWALFGDFQDMDAAMRSAMWELLVE